MRHWSVAGQIVVDDRCFWVMASEPGNGRELPKDAPRFELLGRPCFVVSAEDDPAQEVAHLLTARELQIAMLVGEGKPTKRIAHQLHISKWTVSAHLRRVFLKLGVDNRAAMICRLERSRIAQVVARLAQERDETATNQPCAPERPPSVKRTAKLRVAEPSSDQTAAKPARVRGAACSRVIVENR
jgi:DNA-binding CsgD family transcriptional regulator